MRLTVYSWPYRTYGPRPGQIYLYITTKTYRPWEKNEVPQDILVEAISGYQMKDLNRLKEWLYHQRSKTIFERERSKRRERKQAEAVRREAEQPALFEF